MQRGGSIFILRVSQRPKSAICIGSKDDDGSEGDLGNVVSVDVVVQCGDAA